MYGPLIVAAAILLIVASTVLLASDWNDARSRRAIDRIHAEGARSKHRVP